MRTKTFTLAAVLVLAGLGVSACREGRPGHNSDRHHHRGDHHRGDHDRDH
ncbi:hypothetical protein G4G27_15175 [Sphingomonas sp. So64.6b]|nr:hypothetical protein [Sphingomonas sp. So64.6b]QNA85190.1 hypothetical protein G4G27_15175 [Sphingomonas sp. So64.6b]